MSSSASILALAMACAPGVAPTTIEAIIDVESKGNVLAIGVNRGGRLSRQPANYAEAVAWAEWLLNSGKNFDAGLMQINSTNWRRLGLTPQNVFDPCTNVRAGARILTDNYVNAARSLGPGRNALLAALSAYNTGNRTAGFRNGYVAKVNNAAARKAGVPAPLIPMPSPAQGSTRSPTSTQRSTRPMGGVAPAPAWQGGTAWGITSTVEQATSSKETAE